MLVFAVLTEGMLRFQLTLLILSTRYVHAATLLWPDFIDKKVVSVVVIFRRRPWFVSDSASNQHFLGFLVNFSGARGKHSPPRYAYRRLPASPCGTQPTLKLSLSLKLKCPSASCRPSLKNPCRLQSCSTQGICPMKETSKAFPTSYCM